MTAGRREPERRGAASDDDSSLGEFAGVGLQYAATLVIFVLLGSWLDGRLGTGPWLTLAGVLIGAVGGFVSLYSRLMRAQRRREERRRP